jgi:hypothetical protein
MNMNIAVDFDGTCVTHAFPQVGKEIGSVPVLKELVANGHKVYLFTMRSDFKGSASPEEIEVSDHYLQDAVEWFKSNDIPLSGINENPEQKSWTSSPKVYADLYIDDAALGVPLILDFSLSNRPFVNWSAVRSYCVMNKIIK